MFYVLWDQKSVMYSDLLKLDETVNCDRYQNQIVELNKCLIAKPPEWANRLGNIILLHDNAPAHACKGVKSILKDLS